jgi:peptidoglycan hydrolase-like protein with peptidoglycan-binding domain
MKKFQGAHGLNPTGKLDAKTLQQLGLGSHTAGAAPPLPPVSSSAVSSPVVQTVRQQQ